MSRVTARVLAAAAITAVATGGALATTLATPTPALALSCAWGPVHTLPPDGAANVPTNAVLRVIYLYAGPDDAPLVLVDPSDQPIELTWEMVSDEGGGERVFALTPVAPLDPATTYRLGAGDEEGLDGSWIVATFTTGTGPSDAAPDAPVIVDVERDAGNGEWGPWRYHRLLVGPPAAPVFYEVDVASDADFSDVRTVQIAPWDDGDVDVVAAGVGLCGGNVPLERQDRWLRARAIDLAGNVSATSTAERVGGCSAVAGPASGVGALVLLGLLGLRRRR